MMDQANLIKISNLDYLNNSKFLKKRTWHTIKYKRFFKFFKKTVFLLFYFYIYSFYKKNNVLFYVRAFFNKDCSTNQNKLLSKPVFFLTKVWGNLHFLINDKIYLSNEVETADRNNKKKIMKIFLKKNCYITTNFMYYFIKIYFYKI